MTDDMDFFFDEDEPMPVAPKVQAKGRATRKKVKKAKEYMWTNVMGSGETVEVVEEAIVKRKKIALFDFLGDINLRKKNILRNDPHAHVDYAPYIINVGMSLQTDTLFFANEMNKYHFLPKQMQYDFLIHSVHARKRFAKWPKKLKSSDDLEMIKLHYGVNSKRGLEYLEFLTDSQVEEIKRKQFKGGKTKFK